MPEYLRTPYHLSSPTLGYLEGVTLSSPASSSRAGTQPASQPQPQPLTHYFGGLPYALPPTGPHRFRPPRPLPPSLLHGTARKPANFTRSAAFCPQPVRGPITPDLWNEDCLQLNIHIPAGSPPREAGWPVFFFLHGGFLQWGSPNESAEALVPLVGETGFGGIVVMPAYRVNCFGFLASRELAAELTAEGVNGVGNYGFWDQRCALEWTAKYIGVFGGDGGNITVGGYSAGAHSAFQQLAHELYFVGERERQVIRRVIMWSNSPGVQPKGVGEQQVQFDEFLSRLGIGLELTAGQKLERLRGLTPGELVAPLNCMRVSEFRATTDGFFVSEKMIENINSGDFGRRMKERGIRLLNGECRDERTLYRTWRTPADSFDAVYARLCADYPEPAVKKLMGHYCGGVGAKNLPRGCKDWIEAFGTLYADMQVHCLERGFIAGLARGGLEPGKDILRYRFEWRASTVPFPIEWGVTHASDMDIWFWGGGHGEGLQGDEKVVLRFWNEAFAGFVRGEDVVWPCSDVREVLRLRSDGVTDVWWDERWEEGCEVWGAVNRGVGMGSLVKAKF
ncbi:hypothetical protein LTR62_008425 [Meristemomyces frigidus]|uniref:Carboxylic ester hydrolase n=1 Tax=Meristemomyces frigidus TaxID=1508187 RepID=A0AAN7TDF6_9PEZI|nr:hypothetical protein LTR62_008425 [Meristemomyces frigidus]